MRGAVYLSVALSAVAVFADAGMTSAMSARDAAVVWNPATGRGSGAKEVRRIRPGYYYRYDEVFTFVRELQPTCCIFAGEEDTSDLHWPGNESGFLVDDSRATIETTGG